MVGHRTGRRRQANLERDRPQSEQRQLSFDYNRAQQLSLLLTGLGAIQRRRGLTFLGLLGLLLGDLERLVEEVDLRLELLHLLAEPRALVLELHLLVLELSVFL